MRRFLSWLVTRLDRPRVIMDPDGKYLSRWYLTNAPTMPDGSYPFDSWGDKRPEANWGRWPISWFIHCFHKSDDARDLHSHPCKWALCLVLAGGYIEYRLVDGQVVRRIMKPWSINLLRWNTLHRVELIGKDAWSLVLWGPKFSSWGYYNPETAVYTPWRKAHEDKRKAA
jgi:hypothetical protein